MCKGKTGFQIKIECVVWHRGMWVLNDTQLIRPAGVIYWNAGIAAVERSGARNSKSRVVYLPQDSGLQAGLAQNGATTPVASVPEETIDALTITWFTGDQ